MQFKLFSLMVLSTTVITAPLPSFIEALGNRLSAMMGAKELPVLNQVENAVNAVPALVNSPTDIKTAETQLDETTRKLQTELDNAGVPRKEQFSENELLKVASEHQAVDQALNEHLMAISVLDRVRHILHTPAQERAAAASDKVVGLVNELEQAQRELKAELEEAGVPLGNELRNAVSETQALKEESIARSDVRVRQILHTSVQKRAAVAADKVVGLVNELDLAQRELHALLEEAGVPLENELRKAASDVHTVDQAVQHAKKEESMARSNLERVGQLLHTSAQDRATEAADKVAALVNEVELAQKELDEARKVRSLEKKMIAREAATDHKAVQQAVQQALKEESLARSNLDRVSQLLHTSAQDRAAAAADKVVGLVNEVELAQKELYEARKVRDLEKKMLEQEAVRRTQVKLSIF